MEDKLPKYLLGIITRTEMVKVIQTDHLAYKG